MSQYRLYTGLYTTLDLSKYYKWLAKCKGKLKPFRGIDMKNYENEFDFENMLFYSGHTGLTYKIRFRPNGKCYFQKDSNMWWSLNDDDNLNLLTKYNEYLVESVLLK